MKNLPSCFCLAVVAFLFSSVCSAQAILFRDQMTDPNAWGINKGPDTDSAATFGYDYFTTDGIPEAPNSQVGDTLRSGVKLEANNSSFMEAAAWFTLYPLGQNFTGNYMLRFDAWMNYDVLEANVGAAYGTTEFLGGGIGYNNVSADVVSGAQAIATGDGGAITDWRAFKSPPQFFIPAADMNAGSHSAANAYYTNFLPAVDPPAAQGQSLVLAADRGAPGFQWITWETLFNGNEVIVTVEKPDGDRLEIVRYDPNDTSDGSNGVATDGNISIYYGDLFDSTTSRPEWTFGIVDNVVVTEAPILGDFDLDGDVDGFDFLKWQRGESPNPLSASDLADWEANYGTVAPLSAASAAVPEPATFMTLLFGMMAMLFRRDVVVILRVRVVG